MSRFNISLLTVCSKLGETDTNTAVKPNRNICLSFTFYLRFYVGLVWAELCLLLFRDQSFYCSYCKEKLNHLILRCLEALFYWLTATQICRRNLISQQHSTFFFCTRGVFISAASVFSFHFWLIGTIAGV